MIGLLLQFLAMIKHAMNGGKTPNWMKLLLALCFLAAIYIAQFATTGQLADVQKESAVQQVRATVRMLSVVRSDISDLHEELEEVAERDSIRAKRIERKIDRTNARIDDLNENGTDGTNQRIDELIRTIERKRR